jgi:hypothetical protein
MAALLEHAAIHAKEAVALEAAAEACIDEVARFRLGGAGARVERCRSHGIPDTCRPGDRPGSVCTG